MWLTQAVGDIVKCEYSVKERIFEKDGVEIYSSGYFGKTLLFGGKAQYCEHDSAMRHEIMVHTAICTHEDPKNVLVIDGGDGALAHELLKHKGVNVDIVERNGAALEAASVAGLYADALEDRRVAVTVGSLDYFISSAEDESYDIVLVNRFDDIEFSDRAFFDNIYRILTEKGLVVTDASSQLFDMSGHKAALSALCDSFRIVMPFCYTSMVRVGGEQWFAMGSKFFHPTADINLQRADLTDGYEYYNSDVHISRFALPESTFKKLKEYIKR